jgi:cell wall-associated NlpC family hydrolase
MPYRLAVVEILARLQRRRMLRGTLIFQVSNGTTFDNAVAASADGEINHVGIVVGENMVIEATPDRGVVIVDLESFVAEGSLSIAAEIRNRSLAVNACRRALSFVGRPYNHSFYPNSAGLYCSELVTESFIRPDGSRYFPLHPMDFHGPDEFWKSYYAKLGGVIPNDMPGSHPQRLLRLEHLYAIYP